MVKKSLTDFVAYVNKKDIEYTPKVNAYLAKLDDQLYSFLSRFIKIKKLPHTRLRPGILINLEKISQSGNEAHLQFMRDMEQQQFQEMAAYHESTMSEINQVNFDQQNNSTGGGFGGSF